jgi:hypothetical protein
MCLYNRLAPFVHKPQTAPRSALSRTFSAMPSLPFGAIGKMWRLLIARAAALITNPKVQVSGSHFVSSWRLARWFQLGENPA